MKAKIKIENQQPQIEELTEEEMTFVIGGAFDYDTVYHIYCAVS
ncbi:hypothetical protein [Nostoc sp.]